ncbi:MAG TPA: thiol-disulfide oxidoreductase DCC family protein [Pyrinomonadaceae bacterium]|nr:thiol-disulfide oxidoreductase DCC family protein [Pyrinomonadaceae bacterium]
MGAVVLFDGVCNFCDASVNFVIDHDPEGYFKFAPLQSDAGKKLAAEHGLASETGESPAVEDLIPIDSVIVIEDGKAYTHSTGALRIARRLTGIWSMFYAFIVVPKPIRDFFYRLFAKYRYRLFGRKDQCMLPSPEVRTRFLN